jgi:hypothetical protein
MESINHACKLKCFSPLQPTPYMLLQSLDHLRRRGHLGPLWSALERRVGSEFRATEANKGWAWQIDGDAPSALFDAWNFNLESPPTLEAKMSMMPQLDIAEVALEKIVAALDPPSEAMITEMDAAIVAIKTKMRAIVNALLEELM